MGAIPHADDYPVLKEFTFMLQCSLAGLSSAEPEAGVLVLDLFVFFSSSVKL